MIASHLQAGVSESSTTLPTPGRWLQVVSHIAPQYGGVSAVVPALSHALIAGGVQVSVAAFCAPGENCQPANLKRMQLSFWPASRMGWIKSALRQDFRTLVSQSDGVHIHGLWEQSTALAAGTARSLNVPYVLSAHGMLEPWALAHKRLKKRLYAGFVERANLKHAGCLHALTHTEAAQYRSFGARGPISVIPNGVSIPAIRTSDRFLNEFPALRGRRLLIFLARLHPKKGLDLLLETWAAASRHSRDACLVIAGPDCDGTRARLEKGIQDTDLASSVVFTGMLDEPMKWSALAAAEAFVLPSYSEGLSMGVLEAMGAGLPVIVTDACNMPEVKRFRAGWEIKPDVEELTSALMQLLNNFPEENAAIGGRGAALVRSRYSWAAVSEQMTCLYGWLNGGERPPSLFEPQL